MPKQKNSTSHYKWNRKKIIILITILGHNSDTPPPKRNIREINQSNDRK